MIAVTGLRSGTSLMMQTLNLLGVDIAGYAFHDDFSIKELNPKGFYELPYKTFLKKIDWDEYKNKTIKLAGYTLFNDKPECKVIWCRRNPEECVKSILKLITLNDRYSNINSTIENARKLYDINNYYTYRYFEDNKVEKLEVYYEEMILCPELTIAVIKDFLNIEIDSTEAIKNVEKRGVLCQ